MLWLGWQGGGLFGQAGQIDKFRAIAKPIFALGIFGQGYHVIIAKSAGKMASSQKLAKPGHGGGKADVVAGLIQAFLDIFLANWALNQAAFVLIRQFIAHFQKGQLARFGCN